MHVLSRSFLVSTFLLFSFADLAWAGSVTGRVVDPDGRAVSGATVLLVDGATVVATTLTDSTGAFAIDAPHDGPFEVLTAVDGLRARPVSVRGDGNAGEIKLEVSAVRESVVVSAAQVDVPLSTTSSSVTILTAEDLAALQVRELADALRLTAGVTMVSAGGYGAQTSAFPRGGESDYSMVIIDGVQANAFGGGFDFAHVPVMNIERLEIVRGPQSALYGSNAIGSVIRVVSKRGGPPTASALVEGGSFGTSRIGGAASHGAGPWQWGASVDRLASDGVVENDDYERLVLGGGLGWSRQNGPGVRADVTYTDDERGFPGPFGSDPGGTFSGIDTVSRGSNERWLAAVSGAVPAGTRVRLNGQLAYTSIDGTQVSSFDPERPFSNSSRRTLGRAQADVTFQPSLQASVGGELQFERAESTFILSDSGEVPVERRIGGVFGELRWNRGTEVFVTAGLRVDRIVRKDLDGNAGGFLPRPDLPEDDVTSVNPKVAVAWFVRSSGGSFTKVRAAAGTGIRPPDAFEISSTDNPSLKPERSQSIEGGLDQAFAGGRATIEATAFYNNYDDLIVTVGSFEQSSRYHSDNISNARTQGLELAAAFHARSQGRVPIDVDVRVAMTFLGTKILAVDGSADAPPPFEPGDPLLRRPARQFATELMVKGGRFSGFLTVGGRSHTRDVDPSFGTFGGLFDAPGYAVVNTGGSWSIARSVEVFGRVTNLFDKDYEEALGFPALGRSGIVGLRVAAGR
jgi:outer membrane cobalamin receptor